MEQILSDAFKKQAEILKKDKDQDGIRDFEFGLCFQYKDIPFYCVIDEVKEVLECSQVIPYPQKQKGHVGVINLRGYIYPILSPSCNTNLDDKGNRVIIFEREENKCFGLIVESVHKCRIPLNSSEIGDRVIEFSKRPHRKIKLDEILEEVNDNV